jgi:hypothetical protein
VACAAGLGFLLTRKRRRKQPTPKLHRDPELDYFRHGSRHFPSGDGSSVSDARWQWSSAIGQIWGTDDSDFRPQAMSALLDDDRGQQGGVDRLLFV